MRIMVVGSGAREHALVWKLAAESGVSEVLAVPGNAGIARAARCITGREADPEALLALAKHERVDFTIVGPELPLAAGVADVFAAHGMVLFGPTREAARLECSKAFAKAFMSRHGVPTAGYRICTGADEARGVIASGRFGFPVVLKADGLAAGKGVVVADDQATAEAAVIAAMIDRKFGSAGERLVIEEYLRGQEVSFFAICDGQNALPLVSSQDHKRIGDGDLGPNTGGMGAFAPSPLFGSELEQRVMREIVEPVLAGLSAEGHPYRGLLYVGLMLTADGPRVVEFNVRFGDPETQVVVPMIDDELTPLLFSAAEGRLVRRRCVFRCDPHVGVVLASGGYPGQYETGKPIQGLSEVEVMRDVLVFHAGTAHRSGQLVTSGGRVLTVVGRGPDYASAIERAYEAAARISFDGKYCRTDIGRKALAVVSS